MMRKFPDGESQNGQAILAVLVAAAIGLTVLMGLYAGLNGGLNFQDWIQKQNAASVLTQEIRTLLSDPNACIQSFSNMTPFAGAASVTQIDDTTGAAAYKTASSYEDNRVMIKALSLGNSSPAIANVADLNLQLALNGTSQGPQNLNRDISILTVTNASGQIVSCVALAGANDGIWEREPSNTNNIYYSGGNVGINVPTPDSYLLELQARNSDPLGNGIMLTASPNNLEPMAVMFRNGTGGNIADIGAALQSGQFGTGASANDFVIRTDTSSGRIIFATDPTGGTSVSSWPTAMAIDSSGYVGIGTSTPQTNLDIESSGLNPTLRITAASANQPTIQLYKDVGGAYSGWSMGMNPAADDFFIGRDTSSGVVSYAPIMIDTSGHVGIMNGTPGYQLDVAGDINSSSALRVGGISVCTASGCTSSSDRRLKKDIYPLHNGLEKILQLKAVSYRWRDPEKFGSKQQIGFIAQQVEKVFPQVVVTDPKTGLKSLYYGHLLAPVVEAIKTLAKGFDHFHSEMSRANKSIASQGRQIASLQSEIKSLEQQNEMLKKEMENLKSKMDHTTVHKTNSKATKTFN